jgi:hypothetical protein
MVSMECDYACFNHNSLMSPKKKKSDHHGCVNRKEVFFTTFANGRISPG